MTKSMSSSIRVALLALAVAASCKSGSAPEASTVIEVVVTPAALSLKPGESKQLKVVVRGPPGIPQNVNWRSLNTSVATVTGGGLVTAVAEGATFIRASWTEDPEEFTDVDTQITADPIMEGQRPASAAKRLGAARKVGNAPK